MNETKPMQISAGLLREGLRTDARDSRFPGSPGDGFRNLFHPGEAPEENRWRGAVGQDETEAMLAATADRLARGQSAPTAFAAGYGGLAQFVADDLLFSTDEAVYPPALAPFPALRVRRLMLETLYGEGPSEDQFLYDAGDDAQAPWRLRLPARTAAMDWSGTGQRGAAVGRTGENPLIGHIATLFARLHNAALTRLTRYGDPAERFAAAQRVTRAVYRRIVFGELLAQALRPDVRATYEAGRRLDRWFAETDDMPIEFAHAGHGCADGRPETENAVDRTVPHDAPPKVLGLFSRDHPFSAQGLANDRVWSSDWALFFGADAPSAPSLGPQPVASPAASGAERSGLRRADVILRRLLRGMASGPMRLGAISDILRPVFAMVPASGGWLCLDADGRGRALHDWIGDDAGLRPHASALLAEPPLCVFTLIEAGAPAHAGGGDGRRLGALGSTLMAEPLYAARDATADKVERTADLARDEAAVFRGAGPATMAQLIVAMADAA